MEEDARVAKRSIEKEQRRVILLPFLSDLPGTCHEVMVSATVEKSVGSRRTHFACINDDFTAIIHSTPARLHYAISRENA